MDTTTIIIIAIVGLIVIIVGGCICARLCGQACDQCAADELMRQNQEQERIIEEHKVRIAEMFKWKEEDDNTMDEFNHRLDNVNSLKIHFFYIKFHNMNSLKLRGIFIVFLGRIETWKQELDTFDGGFALYCKIDCFNNESIVYAMKWKAIVK